MAAIRVEVSAIRPAAAQGLVEVRLDCWRATLRLACEPGRWTLDGFDVGDAFSTTYDNQASINFFTLGGLVVAGQPVNLNRTLFFRGDSPDAFRGVIVREYYDLQLPDPQAHNGR